jgi:pheromone shutdown protein TraB
MVQVHRELIFPECTPSPGSASKECPGLAGREADTLSRPLPCPLQMNESSPESPNAPIADPSGDPTRDRFENEPVQQVERDGVHYTVLGTAHVSPTSAAAVRHLVESGDYDAIAIELCPSRHRALTDPDAWRSMNLFQVIRERKAGMMMASLALAAYQRRIAEQFGIEPGAEMKAAIDASDERGLPLQLIDREIGVTLKRTSRRLSWWKRWVLTNGLVFSLFSRDEIDEDDIERLKQGDMLNETFGEFAEQSPELYDSLIAERDRFMAARLRQENQGHAGRRVLAVLGAGHLEGTVQSALHETSSSSDRGSGHASTRHRRPRASGKRSRGSSWPPS